MNLFFDHIHSYMCYALLNMHHTFYHIHIRIRNRKMHMGHNVLLHSILSMIYIRFHYFHKLANFHMTKLFYHYHSLHFQLNHMKSHIFHYDKLYKLIHLRLHMCMIHIRLGTL